METRERDCTVCVTVLNVTVIGVGRVGYVLGKQVMNTGEQRGNSFLPVYDCKLYPGKS